MEKDTAVRNQKVMIRLEAVLTLQKRYLAVAQALETARKAAETPSMRSATESYLNQKRQYEQIFDVLELPFERV